MIDIVMKLWERLDAAEARIKVLEEKAAELAAREGGEMSGLHALAIRRAKELMDEARDKFRDAYGAREGTPESERFNIGAEGGVLLTQAQSWLDAVLEDEDG